MRRTSMLFLLLFLVTVPAANAQTGQSVAPSISNSNQLFTSDLVAWTGMQTPKPIPGNSAQTADQSNDVSSPPQGQQTPAQPQAFSGTIRKQGNTYVLRTSDNWYYDLDDQNAAAAYENQPVAVVGTLNLSGDLIHIRKIEPHL